MSTKLKIPRIPEEERIPLVTALLEIIQVQQEQIQELRDEIARLKGDKPRPNIKPSALEKGSSGTAKTQAGQKRPGSAKRTKSDKLEIHERHIVKADNVPWGSRFKGYEKFTVQGLLVRPHNTLYLRERWLTPSGKQIIAPLPDEIRTLGHFAASLQSFILYQYHHCHVTQPLILEQLREMGVDISTGQVNRIITEGKRRFHEEKEEILAVGLKVSGYVNVDDTGARHRGKNGYCTQIGNEMFAWFQSTASKSRINFLEILRAGNPDYVLNAAALVYMHAQKLPQACLEKLIGAGRVVCEDSAQWKVFLDSLEFTDKRHMRIATEGALLGSILEHRSTNPELVVVSDDAGQFDFLLHGLCWIHAERTINKLVGFNEEQRRVLQGIRKQIWDFYSQLKAYRDNPDRLTKEKLARRFDEIFSSRTCYARLNQALGRIRKNKSELLLVLERPDIPLHNNASETDIREYVKKRHISGSTRSDLGRRCRDTFSSLKKTCRKLAVGFWAYLNDRLSGANSIPLLAELIIRRLESLQADIPAPHNPPGLQMPLKFCA
jgi:Transposase IS66 family